MKRIYVSISDDEKNDLTRLAGTFGTTPAELLAAFIADLTGSNTSGGSDERMLASSWLNRQTYRF